MYVFCSLFFQNRYIHKKRLTISINKARQCEQYFVFRCNCIWIQPSHVSTNDDKSLNSFFSFTCRAIVRVTMMMEKLCNNYKKSKKTQKKMSFAGNKKDKDGGGCTLS